MTAKTPILKLKISLVGSSPPIWRRVLVPSWCSLSELHSFIQDIFDWDNDHLHCFRLGQRTFEAADPWSTPETNEEDEVVLNSVLPRKGSRLDYTYDFGDSWDHRIVVEERLSVDPNDSYPTCIDGRRAAPPEDIGGIWRYNAIVATLGDGLDPELMEFLGEDFDPARFDRGEINRRLSAWNDTGALEEAERNDDPGPLAYHADIGPDPKRWRKLSEMEQHVAIDLHHRRDKPHAYPEGMLAHVAIHAAVESQLALNDPPESREALRRLTEEGLSRHDAVHAIGSIIAETTQLIMTGEPASNETMTAGIARLTRKRWLESMEEPDPSEHRARGVAKPKQKIHNRPQQTRKKKKKKRR